MNADLMHVLQRAKKLYLTTYNHRGQSGTVPIWFFLHQANIYFCTRRDSLKVRRIQQTGRATIHVGRRTGPQVECSAHLHENDPSLQERLLRTYRRRYFFQWLFMGPRLRLAFARKAEIIVQLSPIHGDTPI